MYMHVHTACTSTSTSTSTRTSISSTSSDTRATAMQLEQPEHCPNIRVDPLSIKPRIKLPQSPMLRYRGTYCLGSEGLEG